MSEESYVEDEALNQLCPEELSKYISLLQKHYRVQDNESFILAVDNAVSLSDNLDKLKGSESYTPNMVGPLQQILQLIDVVLPEISDKTLSALLTENKAKIEDFLKDITPSTRPYDYGQYDYKTQGKKLAEEVKTKPFRELSEDWKAIADNIKDYHEHAEKSLSEVEPKPDDIVNLGFAESYRAYKLRQAEYDRERQRLIPKELSEKETLDKKIESLTSMLMRDFKEIKH